MARSSNTDSPDNWFGTRRIVQMEIGCGWCLTNNCSGCKHELGYYDRLYICGCKCNTNWVPVAVEVERKIEDAKPKVRRTPRSSVANSSGTPDAVGTRTEIPEGTEDGSTPEA